MVVVHAIRYDFQVDYSDIYWRCDYVRSDDISRSGLINTIKLPLSLTRRTISPLLSLAGSGSGHGLRKPQASRMHGGADETVSTGLIFY